MIHIKRAPDTETAYLVMKEGFSDYMIPLGLSPEVFQERILERDGNQLEHSFIAYHGERPVAIWLNGLKTIKKKRSCVVADWRSIHSTGVLELPKPCMKHS
ncbi:hypothetical protein [Exiguobacterium artemiae]